MIEHNPILQMWLTAYISFFQAVASAADSHIEEVEAWIDAEMRS